MKFNQSLVNPGELCASEGRDISTEEISLAEVNGKLSEGSFIE